MLLQLPNPWGLDLWLLKSNETAPHLGGNKFHKLRGYLESAKRRSTGTLITMAGAHSNHLRAFAALSRREQLRAHAIIRGDELRDYTRHSAELRFALDQGVDLSFVSRAAYRELREAVSTADRAALVPDAPWREAVFVPEGGLGAEGVTGVKDWAREASGFEHVFIACATGTTCAGFLQAAHENQKICGVAVLENAAAIERAIHLLAPEHESRFELLNDYVFSGFASTTDELKVIAAEYSTLWQITIDTTYMARAVKAVRDRAMSGKHKGRALLVYTYNE
ncbi:pyridoxal-phosphate dependent enzyme [Turneriella parva]|uniref:Pyridoxal-5'-phosphate-dependent protein beta subunit n=1 Tax=Turneriella parva (strain ATCC BAA-1111 / DSM 21527 / NCTC 11395 / H) TaxID=869212 RepID=I4B0T0_TURPD|nr:pyridoxal-phosphate dependent enzyme [Turneriella parva]AFM10887.1 pyridoxal-5'-phosphate-dependent protein beta subunit [Turneriella parva DSM 21527]